VNETLNDLLRGTVGLTFLAALVTTGFFVLFAVDLPRWAEVAQRILRWALVVAFAVTVAIAFGHALRCGVWP